MKQNGKITETLLEFKDKYNLPLDFLHYVGLVGLFPPSRNILKNWSENENVFINLVKEEGKVG